MSIRQIMKSGAIICIAPEERKAAAVRDWFEREISPLYPASILRQHEQTFVYLMRFGISAEKVVVWRKVRGHSTDDLCRGHEREDNWGCRGLASNFCRSHAMCTSTVRVVGIES